MGADASIYRMMQAPDILGSAQQTMGMVQQGMRMRDMLDERKARQAEQDKQKRVQSAYSDNVITNPDGSVGVDRQATLRALYAADPREAMAAQERFGQMDQRKMEMDENQRMKSIDMFARVAPQMKDQQSYEMGLKLLQKNGIDVSNAPPEFNPGYVQKYAALAMNAKEQMSQRMQQQQMATQKDQFGQEMKYKYDKLGADQEAAKKQAQGAILGDTRQFSKEWKTHDVTKKTQEVASSFERIKKVAQNPSAAGDLSMVFNYMKMLDPGSVVREAEFKSAEQARGALSRLGESGVPIPAFLQQSVQKLQDGKFLLPEQRADFANQANNLFQAQMEQQNRVNEMFAGEAQKYGMDPSLVVNQDLFKTAPVGAPNETQEFSQDVLNYAKNYGISPAQANAIKQQRMSNVAGGGQ